MRIVGLVLVIAGALALAYGGFTYTTTEKKELGPFSVEYKDRERVHIPVWLGLASVAVGAGTLYFARKK